MARAVAGRIGGTRAGAVWLIRFQYGWGPVPAVDIAFLAVGQVV